MHNLAPQRARPAATVPGNIKACLRGPVRWAWSSDDGGVRMPWDVTIRRADGTPLGDIEAVRTQIAGALPAVSFHREPSGAEQIAAARAAGREFPDLIRQHMEQRPATMKAVFNGDGYSMLLYGFEAQPLSAIHAELRGNSNPAPLLAALCRPNGWVAVDEASGEPLELSDAVAAGWEAFQAFRDRIRESEGGGPA